jgi:enamine deaminase RidA (YjgF/YER057c/UK114 family)
MSERRLYTTGWDSEVRYAYSRAVRAGDTVYVSGTTGYDYGADTLDPDPAVQTARAIDNIEAALAKLDARLEHVVQLTTHVANMADWSAIGPVFAERFKDIRPAHTAVQAALISPAMRIEITAIAVIAD